MKINGIDKSSLYRIKVRESLNPADTEWFGGLTVTPLEDGTTLLTGLFPDQPALRGFLTQLWNLNFTVLKVERAGSDISHNPANGLAVEGNSMKRKKEKMVTQTAQKSDLVSRQDTWRKAAVALQSTARSGLLLFCLFFLLQFTYYLFHEGGHALHTLFHGDIVDIYYVHPFSLNGYVRPATLMDDPWQHASGPILGDLATLLIFLLTWKRRSTALAPLVMAFPWVAIMQGIRMLTVGGDFNNLTQLTGLSPFLFQTLGGLLLGLGIFLFLSLLPLLGFNPRDWKVLIALPVAVELWAVVGLVIGLLCVPGSPIAVRYDVEEELLRSVHNGPVLVAIMGLLLSGLYLTFYRWVYPHLPPEWQTEVVDLTWKDLRLPALLAVVSIAIGLYVIL